MQGIPLSVLAAHPLTTVADEFNSRPMDSFDSEKLVEPVRTHDSWAYYSDEKTTTDQLLRNLPAEFLTKRFTFDQLCKIKFSQPITMDCGVEEMFDRSSDPHVVYRKVDNSMWKWGLGRAKWNDLVDAYNAIRGFDLGVEGFEVTLDFTTGYNERGYSRDARIFLDGVFAFLVHYRGKHVMTLGFSVMTDRRVLIQQVQMVNRKGNRFLFKLPRNYVEHVVNCFSTAFAAHTICLVDGLAIAQHNMRNYREQIMGLNDRIVRETGDYKKDLIKRRVALTDRLMHLSADAGRLDTLYRCVGRWKRVEGGEVKVNDLLHHQLVA